MSGASNQERGSSSRSGRDVHAVRPRTPATGAEPAAYAGGRRGRKARGTGEGGNVPGRRFEPGQYGRAARFPRRPGGTVCKAVIARPAAGRRRLKWWWTAGTVLSWYGW